MTDDEWADANLDLGTWTAPAAPSGLVDRVLARVAATDEAIGVALQHRAKRRWLVGGGIAAALGLTAIIVGVIVTRPHTPEHVDVTAGIVHATRPEHLELAGVIGNLDPGTELEWVDGTTIHVTQHTGASTWAVARDHRLLLDVGAPGGASIAATNATFRVETTMNMMDARVIGVTAVTSAAVALATVIVYEGQVKVTGGGQTVIVNPGTTMQVQPGQPPVEKPVVGGTVSPAPPASPAPPHKTPFTTTAEVTLTAGERVTIHDPRGATTIGFDSGCPTDKFEMSVEYPDHVTSDSHGNSIFTPGTYAFSVTCDGDAHAKLGSVTVVKDRGRGDGKPNQTGVIVRDVEKDGIHIYIHRQASPVVPPNCDAMALAARGTDAEGRGEHAQAVEFFEQSLRCRADNHTKVLLFMSACNGGDLTKARLAWKQLPRAIQDQVIQIANRNQITRAQLDAK